MEMLSMFFRRKNDPVPPNSPEKALRAELTALLAAYDLVANQIAKGKLTDFPDTLQNVDTRARPLFLKTGEDGVTTGCMYHYTDNFRTFDPQAQLDLIDLFGGPLIVKALLTRYVQTRNEGDLNAAVSSIEQMRARIVIFLRCLARYDLATRILVGEIPTEVFKTELFVRRRMLWNRWANFGAESSGSSGSGYAA